MNRLLLVFGSLILGGLGAIIGQALLQGQAPATAKSTAIPKELTSYNAIVKKVLPGVVSIEGQAGARKRKGDMSFSPDGKLFRLDEGGGSDVGFGSGFLISPKGIIVTNNHVIEGATTVTVQLHNGKKYTSKSIKADPKTDLAIVVLNVKEALPYLEFGDSEKMEIGDRVLAVGAPFGLTGSVTHGIISAKGRSLKQNMYEDFLQTDAAINPGNSGGPLISLDGKVIGINSAIKSRSGGFQGVGMAIAGNLAKSISAKLLKDGIVRRGYLGVGIREVDEELAKEIGLSKAEGVQITKVYAKAPGAKAGLKVGDVLLTIAGKPLKDTRDMQTIVADLPLKKAADVVLMRDGKKKTVKVVIEEQPQTFGNTKATNLNDLGKNAVSVGKIGIGVLELTPGLTDLLGYSDAAEGVVIWSIERDGVAAKAGVRPGWLVMSVDGKKVTSVKELQAAIRKGSLSSGITLKAQMRGGSTKTVVVQE